ncbi:tRNA synthetase Ser [Thermoplasma volcanium GSS1]|uniref:Serine--tRNA ligase n=1 Tax=Thermoplasma volcanium (strain ATCC 51530 / DSM 4299 / JCM 9571 / NBRC 15438 / GSS1) TaxID=273116 RepID=SYS_THEVO|nr:serine--tRNA ligase [Thermoplasma volcanium]Q979Z3.1 RecName: Full=Serine--tRNA ligase; AltName: Full=Seryl-tRNA synthetase; Short=SerRS; AltName: Full=Seryl-tRNA(Ser/Sec) synthetase [Thermoplasma volcanium GSS1]BAB60159.1 tRNA synthetase Ser [Thermoplasma volcanium GSS1]
MIDVKLLRSNRELFEKNCEYRGVDKAIIDQFFKLDEEWRSVNRELNGQRAEKNRMTRAIAESLKRGKIVSNEKDRVELINEKIVSLEKKIREIEEERDRVLWTIPNLIHESVPICFGDENNKIVRYVGHAKVYRDDEEEFLKGSGGNGDYEVIDERPKSHVDLGQELGIIDLESAAKISGARFYFIKNRLLKLEMALENYAVDFLSQRGFTVVEPPYMLNLESMRGATDLETFKDTLYKIEDEDLYLIATSEHSIASMLSNEFLEEKELPIRVAGVSACFRREAGAHGKDTKGIFRVHQFNKIEQFIFCKPEDSWDYLEEILSNAEEIYRSLGIPYRVVNVCSGELGRLAAKKYDIEAWFPAQGKFREIVSASNDTDYQARSLNIKYRKSGGNEFVHTLNSTAIATTRILVAIMENFQEDGRIRIPDVLVPYTGFQYIDKE